MTKQELLSKFLCKFADWRHADARFQYVVEAWDEYARCPDNLPLKVELNGVYQNDNGEVVQIVWDSPNSPVRFTGVLTKTGLAAYYHEDGRGEDSTGCNEPKLVRRIL